MGGRITAAVSLLYSSLLVLLAMHYAFGEQIVWPLMVIHHVRTGTRNFITATNQILLSCNKLFMTSYLQ